MPFRKRLAGLAHTVLARLVTSGVTFYQRFTRLIYALSKKQRRAIAVTFSLLLHMGVIFLILPSQKGFLSTGTTGLGDFNGAGTAIALVEAADDEPPQDLPEQTRTLSEEASQAADTQAEPETVDAEVETKATEAETSVQDQVATNEPSTPSSDSQVLSDSTAPASAGAFGQNGEAYTDLWNAIAPCWNRIADIRTLPAKLTISFDAGGGLSAPPVIERATDAEITDDSLHAEAKALQALSECGAYPMAKDLQNISVQFQPPGQAPLSDQTMRSTPMAIRP